LGRYTSGIETEMPEQIVMTSPRRTELAPFILDLLDFMDEKISEATADEAFRPCAVSEASGALPLLRDRLREDEVVQAQFILVFSDYLYGPHFTQWWTEFARMGREAFEKEAEALVGLLAVLRQVAAAATGKA
jgi:hypothetical protein